MGETMMHTSEVHELAVSLKEKAIAKKFKNRIAVTPPDWTQNLCKSTDDLNVNIPKSWRVPDIDRVLIDCPDINFKAAGVSKKYEVYDKLTKTRLDKQSLNKNASWLSQPPRITSTATTFKNIIALNKFKNKWLEHALDETNSKNGANVGNRDGNSSKSETKNSSSSGSCNQQGYEQADEEESSSNNDGGTEGNSDEEIEGMMMDCYGLNQDMDVEQVEASDGDGDDDDDEDAEDHSVLKNKTNFRYFEVSLTSKFVS